MKKFIAIILVFIICIFAVSCGDDKKENNSSEPSSVVSETSENSKESEESKKEDVSDSETGIDDETSKDTIPPAFLYAEDGFLPAVTHNQNENIDILEGVTARDNITPDDKVEISISDNGGYDKAKAGEYIVTIEAKDEDGNTATVKIRVTVKEVVSKKTLSLKDIYAEDVEDALSYTSSGTKFRSSDIIHVLEKSEFVAQYNKYSADHTNNGGTPFFPNGVIVITDSDYKIVQVRIAAGENLQIEADGTVKNSGFAWTNSLDATAGGGMFKGILGDLETLIPDGGYLFFVGNPGDQTCRAFLIKNLFYSDYVSGGVTVDNRNVDISGLVITLD